MSPQEQYELALEILTVAYAQSAKLEGIPYTTTEQAAWNALNVTGEAEGIPMEIQIEVFQKFVNL